MAFRPFMFGAVVGLVPAALLYYTVPAYAHYIQWQLQHPAVLIPAALIGVIVGWATD